MVFSGLSTACLLASWPTRRSPVLVNPTTEGVNRLPSAFVITVGFPPSITATTEFVVPKSIPTALAMMHAPLLDLDGMKYVGSLGFISPGGAECAYKPVGKDG